MDDLDARVEAAESVGAVSDTPVRPELRLVPQPEEETQSAHAADILRKILADFDFGVSITQQARDLLYRAILPALEKNPADTEGQIVEKNVRELINFAFQVFSAANIFGVPKEKRISEAARRMIFDNLLLGATLDRHAERWPNTHGKVRLLTLAKEVERTRERLGGAASLSEELAQMDGSESKAETRTKLQAGARMLEWLNRAEGFRQDTARAEAQFGQMMQNDRTDVDCIVGQPERVLAFFAPLFDRQASEPADTDYFVETFKERDWRSLKYPDQSVHPFLVVHEIARRVGREKFSEDKKHVLRRDLLRMVFDHRRPLLMLVERTEERQLPHGAFHEPKTFRVAVERHFDSWQPARQVL
ncbi:hypothetical protein HYW83_03305 [Candidatus Peregrinibacteria bacterium]|nr:hypothetical protein [Candidatus Peregrinibacteria bacterium]